MRRVVVAALAVAVAVLVPAAPAYAHNRLTSSTPAEGARLEAAPAQIALTFAESLNPVYTQVIVSDAAKARVAVSDPVVDGATATVTLAGAPAHGVYTVAYRVVSKDGHPVQGSYAFTVGSGVPSAAPEVTDPASTAAPPAAGGPPTGVVALVAIGAVVLVAGGAVAFRFSRRRTTPAAS
ncbi:copper resistance CopC family protein [Catenuloplanes atrovinosus]|nr:copper resistance protein CopC [Catenuloplanes atrovinosus]